MPQTRQDEQPEYQYVGPFGGIQSEVSLGQIELTGFQEVQNLIFRRSHAQTVLGFTPLTSPSGEVIIGMADFFTSTGLRRAVVWTPTKMYYWTNPTWTQVTGTLTGSGNQYMQWSVVGYKLYFSQQKDVVQVWDGITAGFASASVSAVPARYLMELGFHLIVGNTIEAGPTPAPNTLHWTGAGDGTDWTSFNAGIANLFNNLGPITGLSRLFQSGFAFQQWGITQIIPTGVGLSPFAFIPMGAVAKGNILPYSLASFGELIACYVGKDDVYLFDGTSSQGIGSRPIDGNRRLGARVRIFQDLFTALQTNIFGFILTTANGFEYESYWLFIPSMNKAWVYHFDEGNWTQVFFAPGQLTGPCGSFPLQQIPRIQDLVGTISAQGWSPTSLTNANQLDTMVISDGIANSISYFNPGATSSAPTSGSINTNDGWYIKSGQLTFGDTRHVHTVRMVVEDSAAMTFNLRLTNEYNIQTPVQSITVGTGSGNMITIVIPLKAPITGKYITWELSGPMNVNMGLVELTLPYETSGEVRAGNL
jgi:hypothetical protein